MTAGKPTSLSLPAASWFVGGGSQKYCLPDPSLGVWPFPSLPVLLSFPSIAPLLSFFPAGPSLRTPWPDWTHSVAGQSRVPASRDDLGEKGGPAGRAKSGREGGGSAEAGAEACGARPMRARRLCGGAGPIEGQDQRGRGHWRGGAREGMRCLGEGGCPRSLLKGQNLRSPERVGP